MERCNTCGKGCFETSVLPEHTEDLGGVVTTLRHAVLLHRCPECGEALTEIPDMLGLVKAAALARALIPIRFSGSEIRFFRRVLDMTQPEFAEAMGIERAETVSRWEKGVQEIGGYADRLLRHNLCALLYKAVPAADYDPEAIARMRIRALGPDEKPPPIVMERVLVKRERRRTEAWDALPTAA